MARQRAKYKAAIKVFHDGRENLRDVVVEALPTGLFDALESRGWRWKSDQGEWVKFDPGQDAISTLIVDIRLSAHLGDVETARTLIVIVRKAHRASSAGRARRRKKGVKLAPFEGYLKQRIAEGVLNTRKLLRELKDEVAGLFGAINRKDYMVGMRDLLMELYDCPDHFDKDTQTGLNIVENAALSILGVTTPASLSSAISTDDWDNGLLIRFSLLTPEPNYQERPPAKAYRAVPPQLIEELRTLNEKLPSPQPSEIGAAAPGALRLNVQCWEKCDPQRDTELDDRLKGVYGRMHVHPFKLASLLAALDWLNTSDEAPTVTSDHWHAAQAIVENWRQSAHRLLEKLDCSSEAVVGRREQDKLLNAIRKGGAEGVPLLYLYRNLNFSARQARQLAQDLVRAGLIDERRVDRAEWFVAAEFIKSES